MTPFSLFYQALDRDDRPVGAQDHLVRDQGGALRRALPAQLHEVQGPGQGRRGQDQGRLRGAQRADADRVQGRRRRTATSRRQAKMKTESRRNVE